MTKVVKLGIAEWETESGVRKKGVGNDEGRDTREFCGGWTSEVIGGKGGCGISSARC